MFRDFVISSYVDRMSLRTLPILFLNLGGEMLYILDQRLRAQSIPDEKARKGKQEKFSRRRQKYGVHQDYFHGERINE